MGLGIPEAQGKSLLSQPAPKVSLAQPAPAPRWPTGAGATLTTAEHRSATAATRQPPPQARQKLESRTENKAPENPAPPKEIKDPFVRSNMIVLNAPYPSDVNFAKNVLQVVYSLFTALRIHPKKRAKEYKCQGTYILDMDLCAFEGQIYRLPDTQAIGPNRGRQVYELKRKCATGGRQAFCDLVQKVAWALKENKMATVMADGSEILLPSTETKWVGLDFSDDDEDAKDPVSSDDSDFDDIPGPPGVLLGFENAETGIRLTSGEDDLLNHWERILNREDYTALGDTYKIISRAAQRKDNAQVISSNLGIMKTVLHELQRIGDAQVVHCALRMIESIVRQGDADAKRFFWEKGIVSALANILLTFTGCGKYMEDQKLVERTKKMPVNPVISHTAVSTLTLLTDKSERLLKNASEPYIKGLKRALGNVAANSRMIDAELSDSILALQTNLVNTA